MTATAPAAEATVRKSSPGAARGPRRRTGRLRRAGLPYLLLLPALLLELLVHLVPMVIGIVMSFKELTQFYIRDWSTAPWAGLDNYTVSVDFDAPSARPCSTRSSSRSPSPCCPSACAG